MPDDQQARDTWHLPKKSAGLSVLPWREEEMLLTCARNHALAQQTSVSMRDLSGLKYVHFDRNLVIRRKIDRFLRDSGVSVEA